MWNIKLTQIQQYYEKQVMLRGGHIWEGEDKRRKLRSEYGWFILYTRMNTEFLNQLKRP
jgi:hypothetical protein